MVLSRRSAFVIHLCASVAVGSIVFSIVYFVWYPPPYARAVGILHIFLTLLIVDMVLGPVLTGIVYKVGKKTLCFDLIIIVAVQVAALNYGLWTIATARPAWLVFNADRFDLVQAHELDDRYLSQTDPSYRHAPWAGPRWVASVNPDDPEKRNTLVMEAAMGGPDLPQRVDLYRPLDQETENIRAKAHLVSDLLRYNDRAAVQAVQEKWPQADAWLPLMAKAHAMTVLLNKKEGKVIAVVDIKPWD